MSVPLTITAENAPAGKPVRTQKNVTQPPQMRSVAWISSHQTAATLVAFALIFLYILPILIIAAAALETEGFQEPSPMLSWFVAFMKTSDSTLSGVHKVLFPFISTLSIVAFKDRISPGVIALGIFVMAMFILSVFVGVLFDMPSIKNSLEGQDDKIDIAITKAFFSKTQETLLMYLMLLLGVSAISAPLASARGKS